MPIKGPSERLYQEVDLKAGQLVELGSVGNGRTDLMTDAVSSFCCCCSLSIPFKGHTKVHRRRGLPVFSFIGSLACKKLTGQIIKPCDHCAHSY